MTTAALIVAAGRGSRAGGEIPKQYQLLHGEPMLLHTVRALAANAEVAEIVVVVHPDDTALLAPVVDAAPLPLRVALGGTTRAASVQAGLDALPDGTTRVLIHDGARPCVTPALVERICRALEASPSAAPALAVTDALWRGEGGRVAAPVSREGLWRAQTPQGFRVDAIRAAHATASGAEADDVEVALAAGLDVTIVEGDEANIKVTHPADFARAAERLEAQMDIRVGNGFDVHAFAEGDAVILCGIRIPHTHKLSGHSDADVAMHAVTDAIYGALAEGDIGRHFPPSDPQWKSAASHIFLSHAVELAQSRGYRISGVDCTIICEFPKIGPHADAMQAEMARLLHCAPDRVSVKATTSERLGFTGRGEGIATIATATLVSL
jgi:2-C-methyl-D-erythritol 4-phosphate cytidylyltransferase/2-C-methyl-D-erythritol 2,4-cyclodiphosphate synthase